MRRPVRKVLQINDFRPRLLPVNTKPQIFQIIGDDDDDAVQCNGTGADGATQAH